MSSGDEAARHARMRATFDLHELMVAMRREALAREHPNESAEQIETRLRAWVLRPEPAPRRLGNTESIP